MYRQNFLIIDRDFDEVEDLYETEISEWAITQKYDSYASRYADSGNSSDNGNIAESNQTGEPVGVETDENKNKEHGNSSEEQAVDLGSFWNSSIELGGGWRYGRFRLFSAKHQSEKMDLFI